MNALNFGNIELNLDGLKDMTVIRRTLVLPADMAKNLHDFGKFELAYGLLNYGAEAPVDDAFNFGTDAEAVDNNFNSAWTCRKKSDGVIKWRTVELHAAGDDGKLRLIARITG